MASYENAVNVQLSTVGKLEGREAGVVNLGLGANIVHHFELAHHARVEGTSAKEWLVVKRTSSLLSLEPGKSDWLALPGNVQSESFLNSNFRFQFK